MNKFEEKARALKQKGYNCSQSVYGAFKGAIDIGSTIPLPRSIDGKCGALLTSIYIIQETNHADKIEYFEQEFLKRFGYVTCKELMQHERRCNDYVGESARLLAEILNIN